MAAHAPGARYTVSVVAAVTAQVRPTGLAYAALWVTFGVPAYALVGASATTTAAMATRRERRAIPGILRYLLLPARLPQGATVSREPDIPGVLIWRTPPKTTYSRSCRVVLHTRD